MFDQTGFSLALAKCPWKWKKPLHLRYFFSLFFSLSLNYPTWCKNSCSWPVLDYHLPLFLNNPRLTLFLLLTTLLQLYPTREGVNPTEVTAGDLLSAASYPTLWLPGISVHAADSYRHVPRWNVGCLHEKLTKGKGLGWNRSCVSEAFVNKCLILVVGKDENWTYFTCSTMSF